MPTYTVRYTRTSNHIDGVNIRTTGGGNDVGGHISYYAQSACPSLTRMGTRMGVGKSFEDPKEALDSARTAYNNKLCAACEKAALAELAALAEVEPKPVAPSAPQNLQTHTGMVHAKGRYSNSLRGPMPACCTSESAVSRYHYVIPTSEPVACKRCLAGMAKEIETVSDDIKRAKLKVSGVVHVGVTPEKGVFILGTDELRGPVQIDLANFDARWLWANLNDLKNGGFLDVAEE